MQYFYGNLLYVALIIVSGLLANCSKNGCVMIVI